MIHGHGDDAHNYDHKIVSNFSSNIFARQDISALEKHLCQQISIIHSYPEPDASSLSQLVAEKHQLKSNNVLITNGATEAIYLIARAFFGAKSAVVAPTFSEYADGCTANNHQVNYISNFSEISDDTKLVWFCNPNNPDGKVYKPQEIMSLVENKNHSTFVIDRSYSFFTKIDTELIKDVNKFPRNLIEIHSLTKKYAVPGLRLGYIVAHDEIIEKIKQYKMPWSVNALAVEAGIFLLKKCNKPIDIEAYLSDAEWLKNEISKINNIEVLETETHFFLCRLKNGKRASDLKMWLVENYGILIRDASNFFGLDESYFRVATQTMEENRVLVKAISQWINS